jgi:hypothetical protein
MILFDHFLWRDGTNELVSSLWSNVKHQQIFHFSLNLALWHFPKVESLA